MPADSPQLRADLVACFPSLVIDSVAKESGQRVVYFAHFDDSLIPVDMPEESTFLLKWEAWGKVVVKVVGEVSASTLTRLQAEAALLEELKSGQSPRLLYANYFTENPITEDKLKESLYVSIEEFVESVTLSSILNDFIGAPTPVFSLAISVVNGLRPLWEHPRRFVHRDVKPDNLLVKSDGTVVIIDFGIIRETGAAGITKEGWGQAPLSIDYAAPEHIANDKDLVSFKTDVFSIGVIMYQLISGAHPFRTRVGMDMYEMAEATENHVAPSLESLGIANEVQSLVIEQMMEKKPYLRPRTVDLLLKQLTRAKDC